MPVVWHESASEPFDAQHFPATAVASVVFLSLQQAPAAAASLPLQHPLAAFAEVPESTAVVHAAHARWVDYEPRIAQTLVTGFEPADDDACPAESHRATLGWWNEGGFDPIALEGLDADDPPLLVGAIGWGPEMVALVFDDGLDGLLAVVPAEDEAQGPADWVVMPLIAGLWSDADRSEAALRVQSCR